MRTQGGSVLIYLSTALFDFVGSDLIQLKLRWKASFWQWCRQEANLGGKSPNRSVPKWLEIDWNFTSGDLALYKKWPSQLSCIDDIDVLCKGTKGIQQITTCLSIPMERWRNHTLCYQSSFCNVSVRWMVSHVIDGSPVHAVLSHMRHMSTACPQLALLDSSGLHPSPCCDTRNHVSLDCLTLIPFLP